ncbi:MAG: PDZ domain-containing protein [Chitinophagaceae bacterium]|nr:PDZ domain-containing protein [Chitinophagaceae bacterium]
MTNKIIYCSLILFALNTNLSAQESSDSSKKVEKKIIIKKGPEGSKSDKKIVIIEKDNNSLSQEGDGGSHKIEKKITIMVDGDKVTINGKPVDSLSKAELEELHVDADHLSLVAPHISGKPRFNFRSRGHAPSAGKKMEFEFFNDMKEPQNKALLGVITDKDEKGAKITSVTKESAAEKAGLQKNDIITKVNDDDIKNSDDLVKAIGKYNPEEKVKITYIREGKTKTTSANLTKNNMKTERVFKWNDMERMVEEMPRMMPPMMDGNYMPRMMMGRPKLGLKVQDVEEGEGVKILEVDENSAALKAGLQKDDVIIAINDEKCKNVDDLRSKTRNLKEGETYKVQLKRNGKDQTVEIKFPKKLKTADL